MIAKMIIIKEKEWEIIKWVGPAVKATRKNPIETTLNKFIKRIMTYLFNRSFGIEKDSILNR
jgi:hypothetical protein